MIDTSKKLLSVIQLQYRFISDAAISMGFKTNKDYQRFRNTAKGASQDRQVIVALLKEYPNLDTVAIWGITKEMIKLSKRSTPAV